MRQCITDLGNASPLGCTSITFKSHHGKYIAATEEGDLNVNSDTAGARETFVVEIQDGGKIAIKAHNGKYLKADTNGVVKADSDTVEAYEEFTVERGDNNRFVFKTESGKYLNGERSGVLNADSNTKRASAKWDSKCVAQKGKSYA